MSPALLLVWNFNTLNLISKNIHPVDALGIEEWKQEVKKVEDNLKALEKKYIDRCKELKVS